MSEAAVDANAGPDLAPPGTEYEREPVPPSARMGLSRFVGMYAGEHVAGTELMIGPLFLAAGASAFDLLAGLLVGNALLPIPGPKTMVLFGWGLGVYTPVGVVMTRDYMPAKRALEASRTSVFSMDISDADYHSLEVGLGKVSADTGGFYAKTHIFPTIGMRKLERAISGHYVLVVKRPERGS